LITGNASTADTLLKEDYILVAPLADFSADRRVIAAGDSVNFQDLSYAAGSINSYQWSFPGGSPSSSSLPVPPAVSYNATGVYDVSLTIQAGSATHTLSKSGYISVFYDCDTLFTHNGKTWSVDSAILPGFTYLPQDLDGLTPYFAGAPYYHTSGWIVFNDGNINPQDTNYFLGAASFFSPPGIANNWLSFGPFPVWPEGIQISWKHYFYANNKRDGYEVLWSQIGPVYPQFTDPPLIVFGDNDPLTDGDTAWTTHSLSFAGSPAGPYFIWLAFHHFANNQFYLFLDDIQVVRCTSDPVDVQEGSPESGLRVWPNPANHNINIQRNPDLQMPALWLAIYSTDGRKLDSFKIPEGQFGITADVSHLPQGLYILRPEGQGYAFRHKMVISR
ncbi:MAG: T9SS type A sorting domain-containing protein, partial [Bacteroidales bacterium]|nr:T9SS type A sorting domain-containing protein [Bacteroidales bacterium]